MGLYVSCHQDPARSLLTPYRHTNALDKFDDGTQIDGQNPPDCLRHLANPFTLL